MIGWILKGKKVILDIGWNEKVCRLRRKNKVVDENEVIIMKGKGMIIKERIEEDLIGRWKDWIGEKKILKNEEWMKGLRMKKRIEKKWMRVEGVKGLGNEVIVKRKKKWLLKCKEIIWKILKKMNKWKIVGEILGVDRIEVGKIERKEKKEKSIGRINELDEKGMLVDIVKGKEFIDIIRWFFWEKRKKIEKIMEVGLEMIEEWLDIKEGKLIIKRIDLMKEEDVGRRINKKMMEIVDERIEEVDVKCRDFN